MFNHVCCSGRGFHDVIPFEAIAQFDEGGLELLLGGIGTINVKDWRDNTIYKNYQPSDTVRSFFSFIFPLFNPQVILWFWRIVLSFGDEMRHRLLQFVTGTSRVPMNGFSVSSLQRNPSSRLQFQNAIFSAGAVWIKRTTEVLHRKVWK